MPKRRGRQLELVLKTWGGRREGAGRKTCSSQPGLPHRSREDITRHHPLHITLRVAQGYRNLRTARHLSVLRHAVAGAESSDFRITDWSLQSNHIHLITEAHCHKSLGCGVRRFGIRMAKGINKIQGRSGAVFPDRFHHHSLTTPSEMRNALCYVLNNALHHGIRLPTGLPDPFSSASEFDGWADWVNPETCGPNMAAAPQGWLRRAGWRRRGLIGVGEVPVGSSRRRKGHQKS